MPLNSEAGLATFNQRLTCWAHDSISTRRLSNRSTSRPPAHAPRMPRPDAPRAVSPGQALPTRTSGIDPPRGIGGAYMTQILPFADEKSVPVYLAFERAVYESLD